MWQEVKLDQEQITVPKLREVHLALRIIPPIKAKFRVIDKSKPKPFAASDVFLASVTSVFKKGRSDGKEFLCLDLHTRDIEKLKYEPGDTIGILPENSEDSVQTLIKNTSCSNPKEWFKLVSIDSKLDYLPVTTSWYNLIRYHVNIKAVPQKNFFVALANDMPAHSSERRLMEVLSSKEGADYYRRLILDAGVSAYDVVTSLSHKCDISLLVKYLPRLLPRPYSIASSPLYDPTRIRIALSVLPWPRTGVCTGMLRNMVAMGLPMENAHLSEGMVRMYLRQSQGFRLPQDPTLPLILVGLGTGIAPFIGFLQHRQCSGGLEGSGGKIYLFTSFQTPEDYLFENDLKYYLEAGILTDLFIAYTQEFVTIHTYVQDKIREQWVIVGEALLNGGIIYECGNTNPNQPSITDAFCRVVEKSKAMTKNEAMNYIEKLKSEKRYLQDIWS